MVAMGKPLYREGLISRWLLLRALWGQLVYLWFGADEEKLARMRDSVLQPRRRLGAATRSVGSPATRSRR